MSGHVKWERLKTKAAGLKLEELVPAETPVERLALPLVHPEESAPRERPVRKAEQVNEAIKAPDLLGRYRVHGSFSYSASFEDPEEARLYAERIFRSVGDLPVVPHGLSINVNDRNAEPQW